eukprot:COSAG02_NODE_1569_length_11894_cov_51.145994_10_plen_86_part_00
MPSNWIVSVALLRHGFRYVVSNHFMTFVVSNWPGHSVLAALSLFSARACQCSAVALRELKAVSFCVQRGLTGGARMTMPQSFQIW